MAIDKPAGMIVHPTYKNWSRTLLNGLLYHLTGSEVIFGGQSADSSTNCPPKMTSDPISPRIVTRLDKDTSGIVIVALTAGIHARIQADAAAGRMRKEYLAIVHGTPAPPQGSIVLPLARSAADRRLVVVDEAGQHCETRYEVMGPGRPEGRPLHPERSVVRCELITGRTHQIRVHLAARGWPILGDRVYGTAHETVARQALHAWRVTLPHPVTGERLEIEAAIPGDLQPLLNQNLTL